MRSQQNSITVGKQPHFDVDPQDRGKSDKCYCKDVDKPQPWLVIVGTDGRERIARGSAHYFCSVCWKGWW